MPLTLENAGALVPGGASPRAIEQEQKLMQQPKPAQQPATLKVKVLRAFYYQGKPLAKDASVDLPRVFALEMIAAKKAETVKEVQMPEAPAASASTGAAKGDRNAR